MKAAIVSILLAMSWSVYASQGGESNNTNCNGTGNANSPCAGTPGGAGGNGGNGGSGGDGGNGGKGGSASSHTTVSNTLHNTNLNHSSNVNTPTAIGIGGSQEQKQQQGQQQTANGGTASAAASAAASNNGNSQQLTVNEAQQIRQAPAVFTGIGTTTANCRAAVAAGFSAPGFGISVGSSTVDETCELIELSKRAGQLGLHDVSIQLMCLNEKFKQVAGPTCLN